MQNELKVGQTFRVFEVYNTYYTSGIYGFWGVESLGYFYNNSFGVDLFINNKYNLNPLHFGIDNRKEAKQVGLLRITKLK